MRIVEQNENWREESPIWEIIRYAGSWECPRPELVNSLDIAKKRYPRGIQGNPAQAIVEINPAVCAGGGPTTWAINNSVWAEQAAQGQKIPLMRVSRRLTDPLFVVPKLTGSLAKEPDVEIRESAENSIPASFQPIEEAVYQATRKLASQGIRRIFYLATGYTAQPPLAAATAILKVGQELGCPELAGRFVYQDNCVPDSDNPSWELDLNNRPKDRFFPPAYAGLPDQRLEVFAACVNWLHYPYTAEADRLQAYPGLKRLAVAYNFTPEYIKRLQGYFEKISEIEARRLLEQCGLDSLNNGNPTLVSPACEDYWKEENVGKWLTPEQFQSILIGTQTMVFGTWEASEKIRRPINFVLPLEAAEYISSLRLEGVYAPDQEPQTPGVLIVPKPEIPQSALLAVYKLSDLIITRSPQNNASAEAAILLGIPQISVRIPGFGYMGVDETDPTMNGTRYQWNFRYDASPILIGRVIARMIQDKEYASKSDREAREIFETTYQNPGRNYFNVLNYLAGF